MSPHPLQELTTRRLGRVNGVATTIFEFFNGPDELKADFIFCFVAIILFLLLFSAATTNTRKLVGRERTPAALLAIATLFFAVYYGMIFAVYANGPDVYDTWSEDALIALGRVAFQFNFTAIALMLCALFFFNNCTFELGQPSKHLIGLPNRTWAMIISGIFYAFATLENILAGTTLAAQDNGRSDAALLAQHRASNGFFVLFRIILVGTSIFLFYRSFVRPRGGPATQFHQTLRFLISPVLILGTTVSLALAIAGITISNQLDKILESSNNFSLAKIESLEKSRLQVDLGDRINEGLTNFLVILVTLSACANLWSVRQRTIARWSMMTTGQVDYPQQPTISQHQQPYHQQPYQQPPYQQQSYQNDSDHRQNSYLTAPPPGMGYNGYNPYLQQQRQQQHSYGSQTRLPYRPQISPSLPVKVDHDQK